MKSIIYWASPKVININLKLCLYEVSGVCIYCMASVFCIDKMLCLMLPHTKCGPNENEPHLLFTETEQYTVLVKNQSGVFDIPCLDVGVY